MVKGRTEDDVLSMLVYGQKYQIKSLISTCIYEARRLTLKELKGHKSPDEIEPDNYVRIAEGIIHRLEATVEKQCKANKEIKEGGLKHLKLAGESMTKQGFFRGCICVDKGKIAGVARWWANTNTTETYLYRVKEDTSVGPTGAKVFTSASLEPVATELIELKNTLLDL